MPIIQDLIQSDGGMIYSVVLKTMNLCEEKNHHVRPAQPNTEGEKFQSEEMMEIYCCIKYLKKALDLDLSSYWVKNRVVKRSRSWIEKIEIFLLILIFCMI